MCGDIAFIAVSVPFRHALAWWNGHPQDEDANDERDEIAPFHPEAAPAPYSTVAEIPAERSASAAIVLNMFEPSATAPAGDSRPPTREDSVDESADMQQVTPENENSEEILPEAPVPTSRQVFQQAAVVSTATATPSVPFTPPAPRAGRRRTRNDEKNDPMRSPKPHEPQLYRWQLNDSNAKAMPNHEIWHPPPSAYDASVSDRGALPDRSGPHRSSNQLSNLQNGARVEDTPHTEPSTVEALEVDEWRLYAPFPSAYPPTPLPAPSNLPSARIHITASSSQPPSDRPQFPPISEEEGHDSGRPLQPPLEVPNPGSDSGLSDDKLSTTGDQHNSSSDEDSMDVDSEDEDSENEFDATLRTPRRKRVAHLPSRHPRLNPKGSSSSISSSSRSTAESNHDNGSTLRTSSGEESDSSDQMPKTQLPESSKRNKVQTSQIPSQPIQFPRARQASSSTSETVAEDESDTGKIVGTSGAKKSRATGAPLAGTSLNRRPMVPTKDDQAGGQRIANGTSTISRARGRGRGQAPSRSSARIAGSRTVIPTARPAPMSSNSSQTASAGARAVPTPQDRTLRNRT